jgi:NAD(P)-dependent dehydrogenase (short-subunit alcohol dehydrogenase family)
VSAHSVVVTGGGSGIGREIARVLAAEAWSVVAVDVDAEALGRLAADVPGVDTLHGDVRDGDLLQRAAAVASTGRTLAAWVNNAAVVRLGALHEVDADEIDLVVGTNLVGAVLGTRTALRTFLATATAGSVVNISSIHARASFPGYALYDTCKGALESLTRYVCVEYGHLGIRCNAVAPGAVLTPVAERLAHASGDPQRALAETRRLAPMRRMSTPDEIAHVVAFLLSDKATAINGHVLAVDNGMAARSNTFPPDPAVAFPPEGVDR